jgi:hypothetical protein
MKLAVSHSHSVHLALALLLVCVACAGAGQQSVPMPAAESAIPAERCRVYLAREDSLPGSLRNVRVFDGDTEIGEIGQSEYLCWDRRAGRGVGRLVFEGASLDTQAVESIFDLPREAGSTTYIGISILHQGHKPEVETLKSEAGKALIATRTPAKTH